MFQGESKVVKQVTQAIDLLNKLLDIVMSLTYLLVSALLPLIYNEKKYSYQT